MSTSIAESEYDRHEIINGEIYRRSVPVLNHQRIVGNILCTFNNYLYDKNDEVFNNLDTFFDKDNQYMPDIIVVCNPDILEDDGVHGVPDLVVEVLSKTTADRDRNEKFVNYERYGVKEYWIVDPFMKRVEVYHLKEKSDCFPIWIKLKLFLKLKYLCMMILSLRLKIFLSVLLRRF